MDWPSLQAFLLITSILFVQQTEQAPTTSVKDGQGLADALAAFGIAGRDETIIVSPPPDNGPRVVALQDVTFANASLLPPNSFSQATVTVQGDTASAAQMVVIDAAQRAGITPQFTGSAHLALRDLGFINLCELRIPMDRAQTVWFTTGFNMGIFTRTRVYQSHTYYNLTLYGTYQDMVTQVYIGIVQKSSFAKVVELSTPVTEDTPPTEAVFSVITPTMYRMNYSIPAAQIFNVTYKSVADPDDPLLQRMRAQNKILPVRYCNGSLIGPPHSTEEVDPYTGPLFIADTPTTSVISLQKAANMSGPSAQQKMIPPAAMLLQNVSFTSDVMPSSITISGPMLLWGPVYNDPSNLLFSRLDFQGRQGIFQLTAGAQLFIQQLIFDGLAQSTLPAVNNAAATISGISSALPLAALKSAASTSTWATDPPLWIHESIIVLPTDDYLAMLLLATNHTPDSIAGCMDNLTLARADALSLGISKLEVSSAAQPPFNNLLLSSYVGWGVLATAMEIIPADPQAASTALSACIQQLQAVGATQSVAQARSRKTLSSGGVAGVVVGSIVGGTCVLLLSVLVWTHLHRRRRGAARNAVHKKDMEQPIAAAAAQSGGSMPGMKALGFAGAAATAQAGTDWVHHAHAPTTTVGMVRTASGPKTVAGASLLQLVKHAEQQQASRLLGLSTMQMSSADGAGGLYSTGITNEPSLPGGGASAAVSKETAQPGMAVSVNESAHGAAAGTDSSIVNTDRGSGAAGTAVLPIRYGTTGKSAPLLRPDAVTAAGDSGAVPHVQPSAISAVDAPAVQAGRSAEVQAAGLTVTQANLTAQNRLDAARQQGLMGQPPPSSQPPPAVVQGNMPAIQTSSTAEAPGTIGNLSSTLLQPSEAGGSSNTGGLPVLGYIVLSPGTTSSGVMPMGPRSAFSQQMQSKTRSVSQDANKVVVRGVLGRGSWGTVYEGEWRGLAVAVKTLVFELMSDETEPEQAGLEVAKPNQQVRAIMEAAIAASVGHRNLVCTYCYDIKPVHAPHAGTCQGGLQIEEKFQAGGGKRGMYTYKLYLVQELCGVSLAHALHVHALNDEETGLVDQAVVVHLLLDIARGLHYLHTHSIIHGDLKPANVLLKTDPTTELAVCAKLADFGLSSYMAEGATHVSDFSAGTPFYVAPEVIRHRRISTAADIYCFGVLMWQLLTGIAPYVQEPDGSFRPNPLFGRYGPQDAPPQPFVWLQHRCLRHEPRERPTAWDIVVTLSELLGVPPAE